MAMTVETNLCSIPNTVEFKIFVDNKNQFSYIQEHLWDIGLMAENFTFRHIGGDLCWKRTRLDLWRKFTLNAYTTQGA